MCIVKCYWTLKGWRENCASVSFWFSLDLILHIVANFHCKNMYYNDIILSGYIKCDFGADFSEKLQISILCYSLKKGRNYHVKHFEGPILASQGFFSSFGHNPSLYDVPNPSLAFLWKCVKLNLTEGQNLHFRGFYIIVT